MITISPAGARKRKHSGKARLMQASPLKLGSAQVNRDTQENCSPILKTILRVEEMAEWLRVFAALTEPWSLAPSSHVM